MPVAQRVSVDVMPSANASEAHRGLVYLLADHLDAALAMGEDLLTEVVALDRSAPDAVQQVGMHAILRETRELQAFIATVRTLELAMTARVLQARRVAGELKQRQTQLRPLVQLFEAGTTVLIDVAGSLQKPDKAFEFGGTVSAFLSSRGLAATPEQLAAVNGRLAVGEEMFLHGQIRLGTLMDLIATTIDSLDRIFDLYASARDSGLQAANSEPGESTVRLEIVPKEPLTEADAASKPEQPLLAVDRLDENPAIQC
jgi:hypothetical protein